MQTFVVFRDDWRTILTAIMRSAGSETPLPEGHFLHPHWKVLHFMSKNTGLGTHFRCFEADPKDLRALVQTMYRHGLAKPIQVRRALLNLEASLEACNVA